MLSLFDQPNQSNSAWSVADLTRYIREMFEMDFRLQDVSVTGEISNFTRARSGHLYFTLKDKDAQIKCLMWRSSAERLRFNPENGDAVTASGKITVYDAGGQYQLYANTLVPEGRGDLALEFEKLKQLLLDQGLFNAEFKQPIPVFPQKIGIVTSADAAALRDILNVLRRRYPLVSVLIAPTLVQGPTAPAGVVRSLQWLDGRDDIDTIIVARGGGSIEDLWAFNDEAVARAVFAAKTPIISGVGHEVDFTICDFVADLRAPTPSAAAELAVPDVAELAPGVAGFRQILQSAMHEQLARHKQHIEALLRTLNSLTPQRNLQNNVQRLDELVRRLDDGFGRNLQQRHSTLAVLNAQLKAVSPLGTLARGYAIVRHPEKGIVRSKDDVAADDKLIVQVVDGEFGVNVES